MYSLFYLHESENIKKRSLHIRQKEKIDLSHTIVFAYLHLFVYMRELVTPFSFFSLLTLIASNVGCVCAIYKKISYRLFYLILCLFYVKIKGRWSMHQWSLQLTRDKIIYLSYFYIYLLLHSFTFITVVFNPSLQRRSSLDIIYQ